MPRKKLAMAYIVNGLTAQLMNSVSPTGRIALPALTTSWKSIFTMMGYIMKNRHTRNGDRHHRRAVDVDGHAIERLRHLRRDLAEQDSRQRYTAQPIP